MTSSLRHRPGRDDDEPSSLTTYAAWGGIALAGALATVFAASLSGDPAAETADAAAETGAPQVVVRADPTLVAETERLADAIRTLTADRERLATRLDQMERTLGDVTAAIPRDRDAGAGPAARSSAPTPIESVRSAPAASPQSSATPEPPSAAPDRAESGDHRADVGPPMPLGEISKPAKPAPNPAVPQPRTKADSSPADSVGTRTEFGIDIGGTASIEGLRAMWSTIRSGNGRLLDGLQPLVSVRDGPRHGTVELRLIVGPLANAAAAARLCAALATTGVACQPTQFNGQKLALY
ncbi:hypothetical protein [Blastochloris sulfoviridis]|uniref:SPOR domain-containing protein n=1 Tax=Blastochloris sulfoviridis TaxID=50712 RepID=A0A5M6HWV0_9HYPH|nr:hypothetical protein [Blastochloris sulfoviridis]KAA5600391.1 hypothetical protein F1193_10860 [Blastochloris sulfoviridis]